MESSTKGKVIFDDGKYFIAFGTERHELPVTPIGQEVLRELVGEDVEVLLSEPVVVPVALRPAKRPPILCYVPPFKQWLNLAQMFAHPIAHEAAQVEAGRIPGVRPTCYIPAPWVIRGVEAQVRENLAKELLDKGVINQRVYEQLR